MTIELSSVIPTLEVYLSEVTPEFVDRQAKTMDSVKKNEQVLGVLDNSFSRKMFAAISLVNIKSVEAKTKALSATNDDEIKQLEADHEQLKELSDVFKELFWYEVKSQFGHWGDNIGLRKGWQVVTMPANSNEPPEFIKKILGLE